MKHLSRWRVVTAAAATAAVAAGAFGISGAVSGPSSQPSPIVLTSDASLDELPVIDLDDDVDAEITAAASTGSAAAEVETVPPAASPVSARSVASPADDGSDAPVTSAGAATQDDDREDAPERPEETTSLDSDDEPASVPEPVEPEVEDDADDLEEDEVDEEEEDDEDDEEEEDD